MSTERGGSRVSVCVLTSVATFASFSEAARFATAFTKGSEMSTA